MLECFRKISTLSILHKKPTVSASINGDAGHAKLHGTVSFFPYRNGRIVLAQLWGLPDNPALRASNVFAINIHVGGGCSGDMSMPFSNAGGYYNPNDCLHPAHAGDLPILLGNHGYAWQRCCTDRFQPSEVIEKAAIIHGQWDDLHRNLRATQASVSVAA